MNCAGMRTIALRSVLCGLVIFVQIPTIVEADAKRPGIDVTLFTLQSQEVRLSWTLERSREEIILAKAENAESGGIFASNQASFLRQVDF